jgi:hypothetical protein
MRGLRVRFVAIALGVALPGLAPAQEAPPAPPSAPSQAAPWDIDALVELYLNDPASLPALPDAVLVQVHARAHARQHPTP